jgi:hypothetical protein
MPLSGQAPIGAELAERLGVLDIDGRQPPSHRRTLEALYPVGSILVSAALRASTNCPFAVCVSSPQPFTTTHRGFATTKS